MSVSSHTHRSPRDSSSTMNMRVGCASAFITLACSRNCAGLRCSVFSINTYTLSRFANPCQHPERQPAEAEATGCLQLPLECDSTTAWFLCALLRQFLLSA